MVGFIALGIFIAVFIGVPVLGHVRGCGV